MRLFPLALATLCLLLPSCGLIRMPIHVVGGVVEGTARATKAAVDVPGNALKKRKAKKAAEQQKKEAAEAAAQQGTPLTHDTLPVPPPAPPAADSGAGEYPASPPVEDLPLPE
ncbi:hypothetical protein HNR46_000027 [Haloferula luteola]|uniref:Lipoprotein n=1 Tax=Haloferula luteola TaxID=595692 RepID=A0A840UYA8_9BACT|nr:hypothetical protein [Haloferula luteola]MBB5349806.1 hypothetical protein [Haloferula luteola]